MPTGSTPSESDEGDATLRLPEAMRGELKAPLGRVLRGRPLLEEMRAAPVLVTVGDVVTSMALEGGLRPRLAVVDYRTEREVDRRLAGLVEGRVVQVRNPAGVLTPALRSAIIEAFKSREPVTVEVVGEEDLATLVCVAKGPDGAAVVYGQPGEGAVVVRISDETRDRAKSILDRMERTDGD